MEAQLEYMHIAQTFLHIWRRSLHAQSVLIDDISAPELSRKSIKSALLVGYVLEKTKLALNFFFHSPLL